MVRSPKYHMFKKSVLELLMIRRHIADGAMVVWLPNELIFEICRALFRLYYLEISPRDESDDDDDDDDGGDDECDDGDDDDDDW